MIYVVHAVEVSTGLSFERSDFTEREDADRFAGELAGDGYKDVAIQEAYSSLDEMYADLPEAE
jgi:hypothetical protein